MVVSFWALWLSMAALVVLGVAIWYFVISIRYYFFSKDYVYSRGIGGTTSGANGSGSVVNMTCPVNKTISLEYAFLACADLDPSGFQPSCDPFNNDGTPNKNNTQDISSKIANQCNGMNECSFNTPSLSSGVCGDKGGCQNTMLIGVYTCK